ncbi:PREDICTED: putative pentatricopeptide repeat-containing protein At1g77010, mitochondrial isoform X2 [Tarenaya hassleriana]|uniref:putative pentatricopeptide repeat-containing protein At1g77010, mitochondrial isoform X1 n=1 Tax=Tarenaya hassleriana TaxID=28532 RepID=UPI00053C1B8A|nr:PREDICTED: putative pentatricopeptide repeat-containing protein At1g77010, mitochondrial isoform X1 [Tarenaya hassleriana]XP_010537312.1 PREDICTED: putative pentatricopeptide repeat-containing protein At1g77010, mitochondrial isoform X2 [Tarenaya hassleriana]
MEGDYQCYVRLLQSCNTRTREALGRQIHGLFLKKGLLSSMVIAANNIIQMYWRCGSVSHARNLFDEMSDRNCFSWNIMIEGYMKSGDRDMSMKLFELMPERNNFTWNVVVSGFAKAGELGVAARLFGEMPRKDSVTLNSLLHGYTRNGYPEKAVRLFKELNPSTDAFLLSTVIGACTDLNALKCGKQIHAHILIGGIEYDSVMSSSLVNFYSKCGDLSVASNVLDQMEEPDDFSISALISGYTDCGRVNDARKVFDRKMNRCVVLWNAMISGYISNNMEIQGLVLFNEMRRYEVREDSSTLASVVNACNGLGLLENGKAMHCHACRFGFIDDIVVASTLLDMYSKCGSPTDACKLFGELKNYDTILLNSMIAVYSNCGRIEEAKQIFEKIEKKSLISWNSMVVGLSQNGCPVETLNLFFHMHRLDLRTDKFSLSSVVSACASVSSLELGEQVFARAIIVGLDSDQIVSSSLIDLYCKCGLIQYGRKVFDSVVKSDEISWNSMLMGYATNGYGFEAIDLFNKMMDSGIRPTGVTFMGVLSACDHTGLVEEGRKLFDAMKREYHIDPGIEHFSCIVDLLARAGFLEESIGLVEKMPFKADASIWSSVLRGCVAHGDRAKGKRVAEKIIKLDPENSVAYIQLSAIFASSGDWERSEFVRNLMKEKHVRKNSGSSWG